MSDIEEIADRTATGIALAYRSGEADPVEVTQCLLSRIEKSMDDRVFLEVVPERALAEAKTAAARYKAGRQLSPLDGVPVAWKDLYHVAGTRTTAGSILLKDSAPQTADMPCVANAVAAGTVTMGKLNMTEFAYSGLGLNPHFGTAFNPNDRETPRSPGGSSSGSGAAVASRLVPIAIGSDTGGSVRVPASYNGTVGFKTSTGRIDKTGIVPLAATYDTIGPLARSVEDCILADMVMRGAAMSPVRRADLSELKLFVPTNIVLNDAEPAVMENFERSLRALEARGVRIARGRFELLDVVSKLTADHGTIIAAESYAEYHEIADGEDGKRIDRRVLARMLMGKAMSARSLLEIQRTRAKVVPQVSAALDGALLVMPTTVITAPAIAPLEAGDDVFFRINTLTLRNTALTNVLDMCGVAMPNGRDEKGLPTSFLVSAPWDEDERLLGAALAMEAIVGDGFVPLR
ncbi:MAG: amidase family protein [Rhizobiaceae bacterium]|nr:amidase family protein [Rhizobiaceae bacterium]